MQKWLAAAGTYCTGCGACANACPIDAIEMIEDARGFFQAQIHTNRCMHCGVCQKTCPVINKKYAPYRKDSEQEILGCKAVMAEDEIRFHSSSGGAFWVFAKKMLEIGGNVAGAALFTFSQEETSGQKKVHEDTYLPDRCCEVRHILIDSTQQLSKLQKSKYTQSKTGMVYRQVREKLEQGIPVLFCGCPCQVAGLKAYLGKEDKKLVTIDLLCHGVPSQKMLNESLADLAAKRPIAQIDFRDKNYGWESMGMTLTFADGGVQRLSYDESRYEQGFHSNMILCESCYDCKFCEFPRQGDLSLGDFWGIREYETHSQAPVTLDDGMGTSLVFVNTQKGREYFASVRQVFRMCMDVPPAYAQKNRIHARINKEIAREQFLALYPARNFPTAVLYAQQGKADIGIVGNWSYPNYGSGLTYYALYQAIKGMGKSVLMINWPKSAKWKPDSYAQLFEKQPYEPYEIAPLAQTRSGLRELNDRCGMFVLGSDQLLNNNLYHWMDKFMQLDWVCSHKRKIAYAASFGYDYIWGNEKDRLELAYFLKRFDAFSVRETSGVELAKKYYGVIAQAVPDPIFLLPASCYVQLAAKSKKKEAKQPYLFCYILDTSKEKADILKECAVTLHVRLKSVLDRSQDAVTVKNMWDIQTEDSLSVEAWLWEIQNCRYMVTDSFHGMCFAIMFHKPFLAVCNESRGGARFTSILEELGLRNRLAHSVTELREKTKLLQKPIDYKIVQNKLNQMSARGYQWLIEALQGVPQTEFTDYDILAGQAYELEKEIRQNMESMCSRMDGQDRVDVKQWEQLVDHRKRLDGLDAYHKGQQEQLDDHVRRLNEQDNGIHKQWEQLEDHRKRLDGLDASYKELNSLLMEFKRMQEKKKNFFVYRLGRKLWKMMKK